MSRSSLPAPPRRSLILLAAALLPLAACDEAAPPPAGPDTGVTAADGQAAAAHRTGPPWDAPGQQVPLEAGNPITNLNELFAFIALEEPGGFAGVHVEDGRFVIQMVEPGRARAGAMRWIRHFFGDQIRGMPVEFRRTDRSFADLMSWYRTFQNVVFEHGAIWTDVRESANRLEAGLEPGSDPDAVRTDLVAAGVPAGVYALMHEEPMKPLTTLDDEVRPVVGGVNTDGCTLSFNVRHWEFGKSFVSAAHCTVKMGELNGDVFPQPGTDDSQRVGVEAVDPAFWTGTNSITGDSCPIQFPGGCRYADAALIDYDAGVSDSLGFVARPQCKNCLIDELVIDPQQPRIKLFDERHSFAEGQTVGKIGHQTGWETGAVGKTCFDVDLDAKDESRPEVDLYPSDTGLLCQYRVDQQIEPTHQMTQGGDSGSPAINYIDDLGARLYGVLWAGGADSFIYSPIAGVRVDLNPNTSLACDGLETVFGGGCGEDSSNIDDCTGDRESFQCESDGSF